MQNEELIKLIQENITLLTAPQVKKGRKQLKALKLFGGIRASITDFGILLGGFTGHHWSNVNGLIEQDGYYFLKSIENGEIQAVYQNEIVTTSAQKSFYGIRPVISFANIPDILSNVKEIKEGLYQVEFGEYPQNAVKREKKELLEQAFKEDKVKKTGKVYNITHNGDYPYPRTYPEYEYEGKKYIRIENRTPSSIMLSPNEYTRTGQTAWVEVSPIEWLVDQDQELLISKKIIAAGVSFAPTNRYYGDFTGSRAYSFLTECFAKDIVTNTTLEKEQNKEARTKIETLIRQIYIMQDVMQDPDKTKKEIQDIINVHNLKLDMISNEKESRSFTMESFDSVVRDTELKLSVILEELKERKEKLAVYFEMLADVNDYIAILTGKDPKEENELSDEFYTIEKSILPFLKEEDRVTIKEQLLKVLTLQQEEIQNYIKGTGKIKYHTVEDMTMDLRREIHPILEIINNQVNNRDIEKEVTETTQKIITGLYETPKNKYISLYLDEINKTYTEITSKISLLPKEIQDEYNTEITSIMNKQIDYSKEFIHVSRQLMDMWLSLNRVLNRMDNYLLEVNKLDEGHIDLDAITIDLN